MLLDRIYDEDLSQASYVIGCQATGEALVVDARRDIRPYLDLAAKNGMTIVAVTETHIHADYLSGTRELAAATRLRRRDPPRGRRPGAGAAQGVRCLRPGDGPLHPGPGAA